MTGSTRKPTTYLSLVKDKANQQPGRFMSLEALPSEQSDLVQRYHKMIAPGSVLVGVVAGALEWDLRPLILQRGVMTIARVFSPQLLSSVTLCDAFKSYVFHIERLYPGLQGFSCGSSEGYSWVTRKYFNTIVGDSGLDLPLQDKITLIGGLLSDIEKLHTSSLVHGHICPSNVAYENGRLILLDHGFQTHDPGTTHPGTMAPELRNSIAGQLNASPASDVYGIGLVTKRLLGNALGTDYGNLIEVLLLSDPTLRPRLPQIVTHFVPEMPQETVQSPSVTQTKIEVPAEKQPARVTHAANPFLQKYLPLGIAGALGIYFIGGYAWKSVERFQSKPTQEAQLKLEKYWDSGQAPLMQQVVAAALQGNFEAQDLILERIAGNFSHPAIQKSLFRAAFNPAWEEELTDADKLVLIKLGLTSLVPSEYREMANLSTVHPGVVLSIVGHMSIEAGMKSLSSVPTKRMGALPIPYGSAFSALEKLGIKDLSDPAAQALCHLFAGDSTPNVIRNYLTSNGNMSFALAKLDVLVPLFDSFKGLDVAVFQGLSQADEGDAQLFSWFSKDILAAWGKVDAKTKILLFIGAFPSESLSFEQYSDLLRFPRANIREKAKESLLKTLPPKLDGMIAFLSGKESTLTRTQTISLIASLQVKSDAAHSFVAQWFDTNPDPTSVVRVLMLRPEPEDMDAFNLDASRYLVDKEWTLPIEDLKKLALHPEPLARTLAYAKLRTDVPEERALLRTFAGRETVERIKAQLLLRLAEGQEPTLEETKPSEAPEKKPPAKNKKGAEKAPS